MSLHSLIESQTEALNRLDSFLLLQASTAKVKEVMSSTPGDVQENRKILKKEILHLEKTVDRREGKELLGYHLISQSNDLVLKARERVLGMVFSVLARPPRLETQVPLLVALAKVTEKRVREAFRKQKEWVEMHKSIYLDSWRTNPSYRKLGSMLCLQTVVATHQGKTKSEVISTLKLCLRKYRKLRKLGHFLAVRRYFWTVLTDPGVVSTHPSISSLFDTCKKLIGGRLKSAWEALKFNPEIGSTERLGILRTAMIKVLKQTAFATGPFSIVNSKVVNSKSVYQWAEMQLARTVTEVKNRNLNSGFQALQHNCKRENRIRFSLEKRLWTFHTHLRNEIQLVLSHWWKQVCMRKSFESLRSHKRNIILRKICRDKSKIFAFRKWKRYTQSISSELLKMVEMGVNKLIRYRMRVQRVSFLEIKRKNEFRTSQSRLAANGLNLALKHIVEKRQLLTLKQLQIRVRKRKQVEAGLILLALQVTGNRKLLKSIAVAKIKSSALVTITQFETYRNSKLLSAIKVFQTLSLTQLKAMHRCWAKLILRLKYQENELKLTLGFARLKNASEISAVEVKSKVRSALAVIKKNHRLATNKTISNWKRSVASSRNKELWRKVASPELANTVRSLYQDRLRQVWTKLQVCQHRFQMAKQLVSKIRSTATRLQLRRAMTNFSELILDIKREEAKKRSCMDILLFSIRKWKIVGVKQWLEVTKSRQRLKQKQVNGLARLNQCLQGKVLPAASYLFECLKKSISLEALRKLPVLLTAVIRPNLIAGWTRLHTFKTTVDHSDLKRKLAVLTLSNIAKVRNTRCMLAPFLTWKNLQVNYRIKLQALFLMRCTLSNHLKLQSQQVINAIKRTQGLRICIRENDRKRIRLLSLKEREGQVYSTLNRLADILDKGRREVVTSALVQVQQLCSDETRFLINSLHLQRSLTVRLLKRKGIKSERIAFSLWRKEAKKQASVLLKRRFSHKVAFSALNLYRRKALFLSFWSRLRSATFQSQWKRKQVLTQLSEVLKTLRISNLQSAFT